MTKRIFKVTLGGKPWTVRFSPSVKKHYGWCYHSKREIVISSKETPHDTLNSLVHEALHAVFPYHSEDYVNAVADELTELLEIVDLD